MSEYGNGDCMVTANAVKDKGTEREQRPFLGWFDTKEEAKWAIRDAIASGFEYGYVKDKHGTIGYYTEKDFLLHSIDKN